MKTKEVVGIIYVALVVAVIVFLTRFNEELVKNESLEQPAEQKNQTVAVGNYSSTGAIARAKARQEGHIELSLEDEAYEQFGLNLSWSGDGDTYLLFRERLFANKKLSSAFQRAKSEGVTLYFVYYNRFNIEPGYLALNAKASDAEIIEFINKSVPVARAKGEEFDNSRKRASRYGINLWLRRDIERYKLVEIRLLSNKRLASAFQAAANANVWIYLGDKFSVGRGWVGVNTDVTDEEIIRFLVE